MGIFDKAKDAVSEHLDKADEGIAKVGDLADEKTGNKYSDKIDQGEDLAKDRLGDYVGDSDAATESTSDTQRPL